MPALHIFGQARRNFRVICGCSLSKQQGLLAAKKWSVWILQQESSMHLRLGLIVLISLFLCSQAWAAGIINTGTPGPKGDPGETGATGPQGEADPPICVSLEGEWDSGTTYATGECVTFDGGAYASRVDSNLNNSPDSSPDEWQLISEAGADGDDGRGYYATSTTSLAIGTGTKVYTTQANLAYSAGARVRTSSA